MEKTHISHSIAKNTAFMTLASIGQKIISFVYFTIVARAIGVEGTGKYFFALSFTTIFVVFVDMGLTNVLVREAAKAKDRVGEYLRSVLFVKLFTGVAAYLAAIYIINLMGYPVETKHLVYLSGATMLFDSLHLTLYGVMRSLGDLRYEAISITGSQFLTLILGTTFLSFRLPIIFLILVFTVSSAANVIFISWVLIRKYKLRLTPSHEPAIASLFLRMAAPFALAAIFARVYSSIDTILLSRMAGDAAVGWYSIPYKITYAFQFVPLALVAAAYPRFSEYYAQNRKRLARVLEQSVKYLLLVVAPVAVGIYLLARDIILALYTAEYLPSVLPLRILIVSLVFSYLSFPIGAFLNACDRQRAQTAIVGFVMATNILLNLLLIPRFGVVGAAIAAFAGNALLTLLGSWFVPRIARVSLASIGKNVVQIGVSAAVMGAVVWLVHQHVHFTISILAGAVVYICMLFVTRAITRSDLAEACALVRA